MDKQERRKCPVCNERLKDFYCEDCDMAIPTKYIKSYIYVGSNRTKHMSSDDIVN